MYDLKIFDSLKDLNAFINKNKITDYSFKEYQFIFRNEIKNNFFLSFKIN